MKKLLFGSALLIGGVVYASIQSEKNSSAFVQSQWQNITDTVPRDTSDTTHKPDSLYLANFLAKN
jgi:hypothetical protein